jgi:hypothetical protein
MKLRAAFDEGFASALTKFAVSLPFMQRALTNAAGRSGARLAPAALAQAGNPGAFRAMAANVREPGAVAPTAPQQHLQSLLETVPWAGAEHGGSPFARANYDRMLMQSGRSYAAPGLEAQLLSEHGPPMRPGAQYVSGYDATQAATPVSRRRVA